MITRKIINELLLLTKEYPIVTILGPRQAGKTTLAKSFLKGYQYSNLEVPEERQFAQDDAKAYLAQFNGKVIIDEIQRVPQLLSYLQVLVDADESGETGKYILTGSHQLQLREAVSQSLAGRTAVLNLLPLSVDELSDHGTYLKGFEDYCYTGFLPRIYDRSLRPSTAYSNYYQTYVERDVRLLINLRNLALFDKLLKLLAGRVGQVINFNRLSNDVGVDLKTIKSWLMILEASFIVFKLPPYFENFGKRVIKSPKYYFTDVGLLSFLLGISKAEQIPRDPLVGHIFENLVVLECLKARYNQGKMADIYYYRDSRGHEVDLIWKDGRDLVAIEIKSAATFSSSQLKGLKKFQSIASHSSNVTQSFLVYNGQSRQLSNGMQALHFADTARIFDAALTDEQATARSAQADERATAQADERPTEQGE
ncbi:MAG: ATP-binding protein, partial [Algicola sp.]|nr:ATP-binding protein [Algicola sp.]